MKKHNEKNLGALRATRKLLISLSTFYPKLYILETLIKQKIAEKLEQQFGRNWLAPACEQSQIFKDESDLIIRRKKKDFNITTALFYHEASFGFWIELFGREHYKELKGLPIRIFSELPKETKRNDLYRMLSNIKEARNYLYHHRIDLSRPLTAKELTLLKQAEKDLILIIQLLDSEYLPIINSSAFNE